MTRIKIIPLALVAVLGLTAMAAATASATPARSRSTVKQAKQTVEKYTLCTEVRCHTLLLYPSPGGGGWEFLAEGDSPEEGGTYSTNKQEIILTEHGKAGPGENCLYKGAKANGSYSGKLYCPFPDGKFLELRFIENWHTGKLETEKVLAIEEEEGRLVPLGSVVQAIEDHFSITTPTGNLACEGGYAGVLASNDMKVDSLIDTESDLECEAPFGFFRPVGGLSVISITANGKATIEVNMSVPWPAPHEHCEYRAKGNNLAKWGNKIFETFGILRVELAKPATLTGTGCPAGTAELEGFVAELSGRSTFGEEPGFEELVGIVL
jgi:hypothetical protein